MQNKVAQITLDSCSEYMVLEQVAPQMWYRRAAVAIDQAYEQKTVRLTDDGGWEWVEEDECQKRNTERSR